MEHSLQLFTATIHCNYSLQLFTATIHCNYSMQLSSLCSVSKLACKLSTSGNHYPSSIADLPTLLLALDIHENPVDIFMLLTTGDPSVFRSILKRIGAERAMFICDELCAPNHVFTIIMLMDRLDRISENQTINYRCISIINAYAHGFRLVPRGDTTEITIYNNNYTDIKFANIAFDNGLFVTKLNFHTNPNGILLSDNNSKDIREITLSNKLANEQCVLTKYTNIEKIYDHRPCCAQYHSSILNITELTSKCVTNNMLCSNLRVLDISNNQYIKTCEPCANSLRILYANITIGINDSYEPGWLAYDALLRCTKIKILHAINNQRIWTCNPFAKSLVELNAAGGRCGITDNQLSVCTRIKKLYVGRNYNIGSLKPFAKTLKVLSYYAHGYCRFSDELKICNNLETITVNNNTIIDERNIVARNIKLIRIPEGSLSLQY